MAKSDKETSVTILFVDEEYDRGPILHQAGGVPVYPNDTPEKIAARVIKVEHRAYSEAVQIWLNKQTK
ncbi:MAG: formyltransferase family protein [Candidatus Electryonea clarkiae]|nr:formyltransferase family protein [Candidatus Electryonea clarkiae]MDP8287631.1 formyltransferase family protein [Candidatus Electryonea clarkiae]